MLALTVNSWAGGYLVVTGGGSPASWSGTVTVNLDLGTLGSLTNAQADTLTMNAIGEWSNASIATSSLVFAQGADLPVDNESTGAPQFGNAGDAFNAVIYDSDGDLTDAALGAGLGNQVLGFAGPQSTSGSTITGGQAVLNGRFIDGNSTAPNPEVSTGQFQGVIAHEFGHFLNLDHSQGNDQFVNRPFQTADFDGYPTMYPLVHDDIADLEADDIAWISDLYPSAAAATLTTITGVARTSAGTLLNGVNIHARSASDANTVITCVTGYTDGSPGSSPDGAYQIPNLPAGSSWILDFEQIDPNFTGGSSVGPIDPPLTVPGPAEFINEAAFESNSDAYNRSSTFVTGAAGSTLSGVDLRLNTAALASGGTFAETADGGGAFITNNQTAFASLVPNRTYTITGSAGPTGGNVDFIGDPIEDWYEISGNAAQIESMTLTATNDCDLYVCAFDGSFISIALIGITAGGESVATPFRPQFFGSGFGAQTVYVGISAFTGEPVGNYTLTFTTSHIDETAVAIDSVSTINPSTGTFTITGRGFSNSGGAPTVTLSDGTLNVGAVTFINSTQLNVAVSDGGGFTPGTTDVFVGNADGVYSGFYPNATTVPVELSAFTLD